MGELSRIADVRISLNASGISAEGFSTLLIVGPHAHSLARVESYTAASEMIDDGFSEDDPLYLAAVDAFSQIPRPRLVKIGRQLVDSVAVAVSKITATGVYAVTVSTKDAAGNVTATPYTYQNTGGTAAQIITGLQSLISNDESAAVTATATDGVMTLTGKNGGSFKIQVSSMLSMTNGAITETVPQMMAAITASDNDWYGWAFTSRAQADILAAANWTEGTLKIFGTSIAEAGAYDPDVTTDTGYQLFNGNFYRTFWFYHKDAAVDFPECAVFARCFAIQPGGETWALKRLSGVTADNLSETQYNAITEKHGNTFERFRNFSITQNGKVAAGERIDVIRFRDWLQEEITVNVVNLLVNRDKVPYTDEGIALIEARIRQALELGQRLGGIAPTEYDADGNENLGFVIEAPLAAEISANQKASRVLTDVKFRARLAGAILVVEIYGSLTYENLVRLVTEREV